MRSIFRILSKLSLFLIIIGFFQPIACQFNGPQLIQEGFKTPINTEFLALAIILILLVLIPIIALLRLNSKKTETLFTPIFAILLVGICYFLGSSYNGDYLSKYYFDKGSGTILFAIVASFLFAFINLFIPQKKKEEQSCEETVVEEENSEEEKP